VLCLWLDSCRESTLQLDQVSPALAALAATAVPMPGQPRPPPTRAAEFETVSAVTMAGVEPVVIILKTKTRPKKLALLGSDGRRYMYLLKVCAGLTTGPKP
jgi:serine/threonine-protein kinase SMG1